MPSTQRLAVWWIVVLATGCGGSVGIELDNDGEQEGLAGSQLNFRGTLVTEGAYQGEYTLTASAGGGIDFCRVAVDGGAAEPEQTVDTSEQASRELVVDLATLADATGIAICTIEVIKVGDERVSALATARVRIVE